jgi:hypothetical protein
MRSTRKLAGLVLTAALVAGAAGCGGDDEPEVAAGQSGKPPLTTSSTTSTTEPEAPPSTIAPQVVEIPDIADLGLTWDETPIVDEESGEINLAAFNTFLVESAPNAMMPEGTFEGLSDPDLDEEEADALEAELDEALVDAPRKAVALYLGVQPSDVDVQMLAGDTGGPEGARITVIFDNLQDDSVAAVRWEFTIQMQDKAGFEVAEEETEEGEEGFSGEAEEEETDGAESVAEEDGSTAEEEDTQGEPAVKHFVPVFYAGQRTFQCQPDRGHLDFTPELCV